MLGLGGIEVDGGGIVVNSDDSDAVLLDGVGNISANQIRVVGGVDSPTVPETCSRRPRRAGRRSPTRSPTCSPRTR